jgi:hypothetical protein
MNRQPGPPKATYEIDWSHPRDDEVVDFVLGQFKAGKSRRQRWEANAAERLSWARGNQTFYWNEDADNLVDLLRQEGLPASEKSRALHERFPVTINTIARFIMSAIGLQVNKPLGWQVFPQTSDNDDVQAAELATQLLQYYWSSGVMHGMVEFLHAMWHAYATGVIWLKPTWDSQKHFAEHFSEATRQKNLPAGDLVWDFATGFDLTEPEGCPHVEKAPWIIDSRVRSIEWGMERYGAKFAKVTPDARDHDHLGAWRACRSFDPDVSSDSGGTPEDQVVVHELWRPKSRTVPNGFYAVVANTILIVKKAHPYVHGRLPYCTLQEQPDFEHFRPGCAVKDNMGLQLARNRNRSQRLAHLDHTIDPKIIKEQGVEVSEGGLEPGLPGIATVTGQAISGGKIIQWPPAQLPPQIYELDEVNKVDMEDRYGIHRSTMGKPEHSGQSGRHAALMTQGDVRTSVPTKMLIEKGLAKAGQQALWLLWQFVDAPRMVPITGSEGLRRVRTFKNGRELSKYEPFGPYEFNVQVSIGVETDPAVMLAKIDIMTERGWLSPADPTDRQLVRKWLGEEVAQDVDPSAPHRRNANDENEDMSRGMAVMVSPGDDDAVHLFEHRLYMTTAKYKDAARRNPGEQGLARMFEVHIKEHERGQANKLLVPQLTLLEEKMDLLFPTTEDPVTHEVVELPSNFPKCAAMMAARMQQGSAQGAGGNGARIRRPQEPAQAGGM